MAILEFNTMVLPDLVDRSAGSGYELYKNDVLALMFGQRLEVFESESSNDGPWAQLKLGTEVRRIRKIPKKKRKKGIKILQDNGILRQAMTVPGATGQETTISGDEVGILNSVEYAAAQNFGVKINHPGTNNGFGRGIEIPPHSIEIEARPFDQFTPTHIAEIGELTDSYFNDPRGAFDG